jgi:hypothetical protein
MMAERRTAVKGTFKKLAPWWVNEVLLFISSSLPVDSFKLPTRQLLVAVKHLW